MADDRLLLVCTACDARYTLASTYSCSVYASRSQELVAFLKAHEHDDLGGEVIYQFPIKRYRVTTELEERVFAGETETLIPAYHDGEAMRKFMKMRSLRKGKTEWDEYLDAYERLNKYV